jgi:hypothetical protein
LRRVLPDKWIGRRHGWPELREQLGFYGDDRLHRHLRMLTVLRVC